MTKVLLCSEGKTDHGYDTYSDGEYTHTDGVIQVFLQKLAHEETLAFIVRTHSEVKGFAIIPNPNKLAPKNLVFGRKLAAIAQKEACRCIAYHRDEDNKGFDHVYNQIRGYLSVADECGIRCLAIVPMHMTESWLLSDANAFPSMPSKPALPRKPEETWGKPESEFHPKRYLKRVLAQFHRYPSTDEFAEVAEKSNAEVLLKRCPVSFRRFYDDMNALFPLCKSAREEETD